MPGMARVETCIFKPQASLTKPEQSTPRMLDCGALLVQTLPAVWPFSTPPTKFSSGVLQPQQ